MLFFCSQKNERFFIHQQATLKSVKFMIFSSQKKIHNFNLDKNYKKSQKKGISNPEKCVDINIPDE